MEITEAINLLRNHNKWRRGEDVEMANPKALGEAIDTVVSYFERNILI